MTRLHVYLAALLAWGAIACFCAFPTFELFGRYFGGGPIRQWIVNHLVLTVLPRPFAESAAAAFQQSVVNEWLLAVFGLAPYVLGVIPVLFVVVSGTARVRVALRDV